MNVMRNNYEGTEINLIRHFLKIFGILKNARSSLNINISAEVTSKSHYNISKFKLTLPG